MKQKYNGSSIPLNFGMCCYSAIDKQNRILVPFGLFSNPVTILGSGGLHYS